MSTSEIATVLAWHDALNASDLETLVDLSSDDIEVVSAHAAVQGLDALRTWASDAFGADVTVETGRMYVHDGVVVAEQQITTREGTKPAAAAFRVVHDQVTSVFSHDDLESALAATDLSEDDLDD